MLVQVVQVGACRLALERLAAATVAKFLLVPGRRSPVEEVWFPWLSVVAQVGKAGAPGYARVAQTW